MKPAMRGMTPLCSDQCDDHDGKRCRLTGFRPDGICEPAVEAMADELQKLRAQITILTTPAPETIESLALDIARDEAIHCWNYAETVDLLRGWVDGDNRHRNVSELWSYAGTGDPYWTKMAVRARAVITRLRGEMGARSTS